MPPVPPRDTTRALARDGGLLLTLLDFNVGLLGHPALCRDYQTEIADQMN